MSTNQYAAIGFFGGLLILFTTVFFGANVAIVFGLMLLTAILYFSFRGLKKPAVLTIQQKAILVDFDFYKTLTIAERKEFEYRVSYLTQNKEFMGRKDLVVTDRMKVLIAATIAQIGFGFEFITFEDFDKIIIFPKAYYSKYTGHYHKGEVNASGVIVLSWADFLEGFKISDDGYNVGLHEIAMLCGWKMQFLVTSTIF